MGTALRFTLAVPLHDPSQKAVAELIERFRKGEPVPSTAGFCNTY